MPNVKANGMQIEYDTIGDPSAPPLLLIMGLGGQLIHSDEGFCRQLAGKGLFIIRYDHRDTGLSTKYKTALLSVTLPTLVIHGTADPLVPATHGRDTADAVPGAQLLLVEGMGHDLPCKKGPWPQVIDAIAEHTKHAVSGTN